jgi:hypothetical protein
VKDCQDNMKDNQNKQGQEIKSQSYTRNNSQTRNNYTRARTTDTRPRIERGTTLKTGAARKEKTTHKTEFNQQ